MGSGLQMAASPDYPANWFSLSLLESIVSPHTPKTSPSRISQLHVCILILLLLKFDLEPFGICTRDVSRGKY